jgi:gamma-glutamyltranspeptidase/glutathione hydrolase
MSRLPDSKRVWLPNGRSPHAAELFRNPEFARTLQTIADNGYDAFYRGDIGRQIAEAVQADGGVLTQDDLAAYQAEWVEPISVAYRMALSFTKFRPTGRG